MRCVASREAFDKPKPSRFEWAICRAAVRPPSSSFPHRSFPLPVPVMFSLVLIHATIDTSTTATAAATATRTMTIAAQRRRRWKPKAAHRKNRASTRILFLRLGSSSQRFSSFSRTLSVPAAAATLILSPSILCAATSRERPIYCSSA